MSERSSLIADLSRFVDASDLHAMSDDGLRRLSHRCAMTSRTYSVYSVTYTSGTCPLFVQAESESEALSAALSAQPHKKPQSATLVTNCASGPVKDQLIAMSSKVFNAEKAYLENRIAQMHQNLRDLETVHCEHLDIYTRGEAA